MDEALKNIHHDLCKELSIAFSEEIKIFTRTLIPSLQDLEKQIDQYLESQKKVQRNTNVQEKPPRLYQVMIDHHTTIEKKIEEILERLQKQTNIFNYHERTIKVAGKELSKHPLTIKREQDPGRFLLDGSENIFWRICKSIKFMLFYITTVPKRVGNIFRVLFKKNRKPIKYWQHVFNLHNVLNVWTLWPFLSESVQIRSILSAQLIETANILVDKENNLLKGDHTNLSTSIDWLALEQELEKEAWLQLNNFRKEQFFILDKKIGKAGTIELTNRNIQRFERKIRAKAISQCLENSILWKNRIVAFFEKWKYKQILHIATSEVKKSYYIFLQQLKQRSAKTIKPSIMKQSEFVSAMQKEFESIGEDDIEGLRAFIVKRIYKMNKELAPQVDETAELLFAQNLLNIAENLENDITNITDLLPEKTLFIKTAEFTQGNNEVDISTFSLKELVAFESLNHFKKGMLAIKQELSSNLEKMSKDAQDFHQILDFCFDSALDIIDNEVETQEEETPGNILADGMNKALVKNEELLELAQSFNKKFSEATGDNINKLTQEIIALQDPENLADINLRLTKAKMLQKTRQYRRKLSVLLSNASKAIRFKTKLFKKRINLHIKAFKRKLRLIEPETYISSQLSNFLVDMYENINKLPLVYRRLFEHKPVEEMNLFLGRERELKKLQLAYKEWQGGNYAATIIYGENGCGKSSLIHHFIKTTKTRHRISLFKVNDFYFSKDSFFELMQKVMEVEINTKQDIDSHLKDLTYKKIIIIDGIERLFLRKISGYECLQQLLEMIAQTNKNIFWIVSASYHAWNYLCKTIQADDYFDYHVEMDILKDHEIKDIVLKRNRLSGYKTIFQPSNEDNKSRKFQKMKPEKQQEYLEQKYFVKLNSFARSNLSLALSYWLESIKALKENILYIKYFKAPGFSFLTTLSQEKIYTLMIIVLHGKITTECHAEIFHHPIEKSRRILLVMNEDAILVKRGPYYFIHAILYRHVIDLLRNRNLIH